MGWLAEPVSNGAPRKRRHGRSKSKCEEKPLQALRPSSKKAWPAQGCPGRAEEQGICSPLPGSSFSCSLSGGGRPHCVPKWTKEAEGGWRGRWAGRPAKDARDLRWTRVIRLLGPPRRAATPSGRVIVNYLFRARRSASRRRHGGTAQTLRPHRVACRCEGKVECGQQQRIRGRRGKKGVSSTPSLRPSCKDTTLLRAHEAGLMSVGRGSAPSLFFRDQRKLIGNFRLSSCEDLARYITSTPYSRWHTSYFTTPSRNTVRSPSRFT